jgi:hypothetical protein
MYPGVPPPGDVLHPRPAVPRQPEVQHPHPPVLPDQHVLRLKIAVHQPRRVRRRQPAPRLHEHLHDLRPAPPRPRPLAQPQPAHELHRQEHPPVRDPDLVHVDHVRVGQPRLRLRLAQQRPRLRRPGRPLQELDRHLAIQLLVVRREHHPHPAAAEQLEQRVAPDLARLPEPREHRLELRRRLLFLASDLGCVATPPPRAQRASSSRPPPTPSRRRHHAATSSPAAIFTP